MHYHPFRDQFWLPLLLGIFSGLFSIPTTIGTTGLLGLLGSLLPSVFGTGS